MLFLRRSLAIRHPADSSKASRLLAAVSSAAASCSSGNAPLLARGWLDGRKVRTVLRTVPSPTKSRHVGEHLRVRGMGWSVHLHSTYRGFEEPACAVHTFDLPEVTSEESATSIRRNLRGLVQQQLGIDQVSSRLMAPWGGGSRSWVNNPKELK